MRTDWLLVFTVNNLLLTPKYTVFSSIYVCNIHIIIICFISFFYLTSGTLAQNIRN